jgi:hypothetical protein
MSFFQRIFVSPDPATLREALDDAWNHRSEYVGHPPEFLEHIQQLRKLRNATYQAYFTVNWTLHNHAFQQYALRDELPHVRQQFLVLMQQVMCHNVYGLRIDSGDKYVLDSNGSPGNERTLGVAMDVIREWYVSSC